MGDIREDPAADIHRAEDPETPVADLAASDAGSSTQDPLILIPVSADDFSRQKRRRVTILVTAAVLALIAVGYIYKRSTDPLRAREAYDAGERLFRIARYPQAILSFDRAISLTPEYAEAYLMRGRSRMTINDPERAIQDFTQVIALKPNDAAAYLDRAAAYLEYRRFDDSLQDCTKALSINPKFSAAYNLRGMVLRTTGRTPEALGELNKAVEIQPNLDNYYQRGATLQALGRHKEAIADFDLAVSFNPYSAQPYFARAESKRATGDETGAKRDHLHGRILDGR